MGPVQVQCERVNVLQWLMCEFELSLLPGWSVELAPEPRAGAGGMVWGWGQPSPVLPAANKRERTQPGQPGRAPRAGDQRRL